MPRQFNCSLYGMDDEGVRPLVSVVIACSNQAPHLRDTVRSATARTVRVEIIVVDDGSTDPTAAVARTLREVLLIRQSNRGLSAARNRGLRASSGDFVIFLDAGDRLMPGAIDLGARALAAHLDCAMAYGRYATMGADGQLTPEPELPLVRSGHHAALLQTNFIWMPATAIFRREAVASAGGFGQGVDAAADYDLYLRLSRGAGVHDHGRLVAACRRDDAATARHSARLLRDTLTVMLRNRPEAGSELERAWREGYGRWQDLYGGQLVDEIRADVQRGAYGDGWRKSLVLLRLAPWVLARGLRPAAAIPATESPSPSRRVET